MKADVEWSEENTKNRNLIWPSHFRTPTRASRHIYDVGDLSHDNGLKLGHTAPDMANVWAIIQVSGWSVPMKVTGQLKEGLTPNRGIDNYDSEALKLESEMAAGHDPEWCHIQGVTEGSRPRSGEGEGQFSWITTHSLN